MRNKINILISVLLLCTITNIVLATEYGDLFGSDSIDDRETNEFLSTSNKLGLLIPAVLLVITIIMFAIDYGAVGISAASAISLVILFFLKIVYLNPVSLISFVIMVFIMLFKLTR